MTSLPLLLIACSSFGFAIKLNQRPVQASCPTTVPIKGKQDAGSGITSYTFKYANAPRWQEAQLIDIPKAGQPLDASMEGDKCLQGYCVACGWVVPNVTKISKEQIMNGAMGKEDCLFASFFSLDSDRNAGKKMPMVFHVHHGQGLYGYKAELGEVKHVVQNGIVAASANMRLGAMGIFAHPEVTQPNLQLSDMINALRFVNKYACVAGGDPSHLTLTGSSTGATMVASLLASPAAKGLFSAAWINSPTGLGLTGFHTKDRNQFFEDHTKPCMEAAGCNDLQCLTAMSGEDVVTKFIAGKKSCSLSRYAEDVKTDTGRIPGAPWDGTLVNNMLETSCNQQFASAHVPIVIGAALNEMDNLKFNFGDLKKEGRKSLLSLAALGSDNKDTQSCIMERLNVRQDSQSTAEDSGFFYGTYLFGTSRNNAPRWHFTLTAPASKDHRAWHTQAELYTWNHSLTEPTNQYDPVAKEFIMENASPELREYFASNFINFVKTGKVADPNWPQTRSVGAGELGGLPSKDLGNKPYGTITDQYHHDPLMIKALHSLSCKHQVPEELKSCETSPRADGGVTPQEKFKHFNDEVQTSWKDMNFVKTQISGILTAAMQGKLKPPTDN